MNTAQPTTSIDSMPETTKPSPWIVHPVVDMAVGCGGWSLPLLLLAFPFASAGNARSALVFYALALVCNYPHYMATVYRAFRTREAFRQYRFYTVHVTVLALAVAVAMHWVGWLLPWVYTLYVLWSPWHYTGQNFGLAMMFARRHGIAPTPSERNGLYLAFLVAYATLLLNLQAGPSSDPLVLSIGLSRTLVKWETWGLTAVFLGLVGWSFWRLAKRVRPVALLAPACLMATQFLWFMLPVLLASSGKVEIPQTRYTVGVLAFMHSAQYLWITSFYASRESAAVGVPWKRTSYWSALIVGGICLFVPGPWLFSYVFDRDFSSSFFIFTAVVNLHHFILDGAIWKLRDRRVAAVLVAPGSPDAMGEAARAGLNRFTAWGQAGGGRLLRFAFAAGLVVLAGFDQAKFYLTSNADSPLMLDRAARLNPNDTRVQLLIARRDFELDRPRDATAALSRAVALDPYNLEAQRLLGETLLREKRFDEAYDHYGQMIAHHSRDVDGFVNFGILAERFGNDDAALRAWDTAVRLAPDRRQIHLYLAETYNRRSNAALAVRHYQQYLALIPTDAADFPIREIVPATYGLADNLAKTNDVSGALAAYGKAIALAASAREPGLAGLGSLRRADLLAAVGKRSDAAKHYQQAIGFDEQAGDNRAIGVDWFNYGQFLKENSVAPEVVHACLLKARETLADSDPEAAQTVSTALGRIEAELGPAIPQSRKRMTENLDRARTLAL